MIDQDIGPIFHPFSISSGGTFLLFIDKPLQRLEAFSTRQKANLLHIGDIVIFTGIVIINNLVDREKPIVGIIDMSHNL